MPSRDSSRLLVGTGRSHGDANGCVSHCVRVVDAVAIIATSPSLRRRLMESRPMTCGEIVERMIQMVPAITRLVDRLEKQGLVSRQRCADDRRVVHVNITDKGSATVDPAYPALLVLEKELLRQLNDDELKQFIGLMNKTRKSLTEAERSTQDML